MVIKTKGTQINSKKGLTFYLIMALLLLAMGAVTSGLVNILIIQPYETFPLAEAIVGTFLVSICLLNILIILRVKIAVTKEVITYRSMWVEKVLTAEDIIVINALPTFFGRYLIHVKRKSSGRFLMLATAHFSNHSTILKAVVEAAYRANPDIKLNNWLKAEYGTPPYSIFRDR